MKAILLGLDGASLDVLERVMAFKRLPNFEEILEKGSSGELRSVYPYTSASAWASLLSGKNPAKHGIFEMFDVQEGQLVPSNILSSVTPYIWDYLSRAGKKILTIGVPFAYPAPKVNGIFVNGRFAPLSAYPKELVNTLTEWRYKQASPFPETKDAFGDFLKRGKETIIREILDLFRKRQAISLRLFDKEEWDASLVIENLPDEILHKAFNDEEILCEVFGVLDEMVGAYLSRLKAGDLLVIVSDHGFSSLKNCFLLNQWLINSGYLCLKSRKSSKLTRFIGSLRVAMNVYRSLLRVFPSIFQKIGQSVSDDLIFSPCKIDANSKAVAYNINEPVAWIKVLTEDQSKKKKILEKIENELLDFAPGHVVKHVFRLGDIYSGQYITQAIGDMIVEAEEGFTLDTFRLTNGKLFLPPLAWKEGIHQIDGILMAYGSCVEHFPTRIKASIHDVVPTLLHYLALPIPSNMDGKVIKQIFAANSEPASREEIVVSEETIKSDREIQVYSKEEEKAVLKRLKALGYL